MMRYISYPVQEWPEFSLSSCIEKFGTVAVEDHGEEEEARLKVVDLFKDEKLTGVLFLPTLP
jgi:hypothetical protein